MNARRAALAAALAAAVASGAGAEWRQAETEHFRIVFEARDQASADQLAAVCEDVYAKVTGFFRSYPKSVTVVIRGRLDYANGLTAPFPGRVELIVTAPSWPWLGARSQDWLRILLTHELTHYVHLGMERGFFDALSRVFGADARWGTAVFLPGWMLEGPTTNLETLFTAGGRGRNPFFESLYKAPTTEGRLFSLAQASYASAFPPSGRIYVAGYVLVDHLLRTYGEDAFTRIMDEYLRFPFFGPWRAIRKVTGTSARAIYDDLKARLEERYRGAGRVAGGVRCSPDRIGDWQHPVATERGVYASRTDLDTPAAIVRLDAADGSESPITFLALTDPSSFTATLDGRTLYAASFFTDRRPIDGEQTVSDLSRIDAETGAVHRITTGAHLWHPAVSADGRRLVAVQGAGPYTRLVEVDPSTGSTRVLFSVAGANVFNPAFSPDGRRIALVLNRRGIQDVVIVDAAEALARSRVSGGPRDDVVDVNVDLARQPVGSDPCGEYFPAWVGNDRLLFSSDRSGSLVLYEADLATARLVVAQTDPVAASEGIVAGDGTLIYASYTAEGFCLKRAPYEPAREEATQLPGGGGAVVTESTTAAARLASVPYRDRARPYLWYPMVTVGPNAGSLSELLAAVGAGDPSAWDVGLGAEVLAGSYVGTSAWSVGAAWHPLSAQPEVSISLSKGLANVTVAAWAATGYYPSSGSYLLASDAGFDVSVPLVAESSYGSGTSLAVGGGAILLSQISSSAPFTFGDALAAGSPAWAHGVLLEAGIGFARGTSGGVRDFLAPRLMRLSAAGEAMLPVLDGSSGARLTLLAQAGLPVFWEHLLLRGGLKAAYGIASLDNPSESLAVPRGMFAAEARPEPGRLLASLDLLAPIGLFDQPLAFGIGLLGMEAGVHLEALADWRLDPAAFHVPWLYVGAELSFLFGASSVQLPVSIGISARFDPSGAKTFDVMSDLRPYVLLSFDSFRDAGRVARPTSRILVR